MSINLSGSLILTGSLTVTGGITMSGSIASASYAANASFLNNSGSGEFVPTGSFNTFSSSILTYTGSANSRFSSIESTTASLNAASGSAITRLSALESASGSAITRLNSIESTTGSLNTASGSAITRLNSLESKTGSYATTGSNTFVDGQYISASFNPTGFTTTASLYTDGGLRVGRDAYISGTLYLNNVTVYGTQSVCFITSSQLNIASNIISVNTATPSVRFGGLSVYDSGSTGLTGSILWDSQDNQWIYSNPSGSEYDSAMFLVGPRSTGALGSEVGIGCNFLSKGNGLHHMTSSGIFDGGNSTCFYGQSFISASGNACFSGQVCSNTVSTTDGTNVSTLANNYLRYSGGDFYLDACSVGSNFRIRTSNASALDTTALFVCGKNGNIGIGTTTPSYRFHVQGTAGTIARITDGTSHIDFYAGSGVNEIATVSPLAITVNSAERARITSTGNVGINITTPCSKLHVQFAGTTTTTCMTCLKDGALVLYNANAGSSTDGTVGIFGQNAGALGLSSGIGFSRESSGDWGTQIRFYTHPTTTSEIDIVCERMRITGNGCVGIGCTTPGFTLDVNGTFNVRTSTGSEVRIINYGGSSAKIRGTQSTLAIEACGAFTVESGGATERLRISENGIACFACQVCSGVGFYASSLQSGVTIDSTTNGDTIIASRGLNAALHGIVRTVGQNGTTCMQIISTRNSVDGNLPASVNALWGLTNHDMVIATNNTERMRITSAGNVGIGVTPSAWDTTQTRVLELGTIGNYYAGYVGSSVLYIGTNSYLDSGGWKYARSSVAATQIDTGGGQFRFLNAAAGTANAALTWCEPMRISSTGNVGIGTTVGTAALGIGGSDAQTTANLTDAGTRKGMLEIIPVGGAAGYGGALVLGSDTWGTGAGRGQIALKALLINGSGCGTSDLAFSLRNDPACSNLTERMRITSDGAIGIGCSTPSYRLDIVDTCTSGVRGLRINTASNSVGPSIVLRYTPGGLINWLVGTSQAVSHAFEFVASCALSGDPGVNGTTRMILTCGGQLGIGTTSTSAEANLFLGAQGTLEGGQLVLQKATSCNCATHLDNYQNSFRIMSGTDTGSTTVNMSIDHRNSNACFYGTMIQSPSVISNNNAPFGTQVNGGYRYFGGTLANGEKFGSQGGTYVQGFYLISWFDGASGRGYGLFATVQPAANAGTVLISSGGIYAVSASYNAANAVSLAFDGSSRGAVLSNNTGVSLTFYAYVFGGV